MQSSAHLCNTSVFDKGIPQVEIAATHRDPLRILCILLQRYASRGIA